MRSDWLGLIVVAGVPFYFILHTWLAASWSGRWRIASLVPLLFIGPAVAFSLSALSHGSNLWPLTVIFLAPLGLVYLVILCAIRTIANGSSA